MSASQQPGQGDEASQDGQANRSQAELSNQPGNQRQQDARRAKVGSQNNEAREIDQQGTGLDEEDITQSPLHR